MKKESKKIVRGIALVSPRGGIYDIYLHHGKDMLMDLAHIKYYVMCEDYKLVECEITYKI